MAAAAEQPQDEGEAPGASPPVRTISQTVAGTEVHAVTGGQPPAVEAVPGAGVAALRVSPDAAAMLRWLDSDPDALPRGEALLLELGCGHGLLGLACAALRPRAALVLTDAEALLPFAERSLAANSSALAARAAARPLPFGEAAALEAVLREFGAPGAEDGEGRAVLAVGAGICYWECVYVPLAQTLEQLCAAGGRALLGYFKRDWKVERSFWTKLLPRHGLQAEVLWEGEVEEPEDATCSAPTCTRTAGEWNARVYSVQRAPAAPAAAAEANSWQQEFAYKGEKPQRKGKSGAGGKHRK